MALCLALALATGGSAVFAEDCNETGNAAMPGSIKTEDYDSHPKWTIAGDVLEKMVVAGAGALPPAEGVVAAYELANDTKDFDTATLDREDASLRIEAVLSAADTGILKGLHARGISLHSGLGNAVSNDLVKLANDQYGGNSSWVYLERVTDKQFSYGIKGAGLKFALTTGADLAFGSDVVMKFLGKNARRLGISGPLDKGTQHVLRHVGWDKLYARSTIAASASTKILKVMGSTSVEQFFDSKAVERYFSEQVKAASCSALNDLYAQIMDAHGSRLQPTSYRQSAAVDAFRAALVAQPERFAPVVAEAYAVAVQAAAPVAQPIAIPTAYVPPTPPLVLASAHDAVVQSISNDNSWIRYANTRRIPMRIPPPKVPGWRYPAGPEVQVPPQPHVDPTKLSWDANSKNLLQ